MVSGTFIYLAHTVYYVSDMFKSWAESRESNKQSYGPGGVDIITA